VHGGQGKNARVSVNRGAKLVPYSYVLQW